MSGSDRRTFKIARAFRLLILGCVLSVAAASPLIAFAQESRPRVVVGHIDGTITPVMAGYVDRVIRDAEQDGAAAVVFEMDTPGGLGSAMDDIIRDILESDVPVVVYVGPRGARAASAGVYIAYAAHVSAMAPGTNIGSASPILTGSDGSVDEGDTLTRKVTNDAVAQIKNLAELRGRNAEWAVKAVRDADNITADEALALDVIDLIAPDLKTLLEQINGRVVAMESGTATLATANANTSDQAMSIFEELLQLIADPTIAYLLVSMGLLGIYVELSNPGIGVPGIFGGISVLLGFFSLGTIPVNWAGALLIALAFILLAVDIYVPSFGTLTVGGLVSFVLGSYLLVGESAPPGYDIEPAVIWAVTGCLLAFSLFLGAMVVKARLRPPATGREALLGAVGVVRVPLTPVGMVMIHGELWEAEVDAGERGSLDVGSRVAVDRVDGLRIWVRLATDAEIQRSGHIVGDRHTVIPVTGVARTNP